MLSFNSVVLPTPTSVNTDYTEVVKSRESLSGRTVRRVLRKKRIITCKWDQLTQAELQVLLIAKSAENGTLKYWDELEADFKTTTVYVEDVNSTLEHARVNGNKLKTISNITVSFKEF